MSGYFRADLLAAIKADLLFHIIALAYACLVFALAFYIGRPEKMLALMYARRFLQLAFAVLLLFIAWQLFASLKEASPLNAWRNRLISKFTPLVVSRILLFTNIAIFYGTFTSCKRMLADLLEFSYDEKLAQLDFWLHGVDPWRLFGYTDGLTRAFQVFYLHGWLLCMVGFSLYVIITQAKDIVRRYLLTFYASWILLGNVFAATFMSAGPVYYNAVTGSDRFEPLLDKIEFSYGMAGTSVDVQDLLWQDYMLDLGLLGSGISAFPSLHVAMATLWAVTSLMISFRLFVCMLCILIGVQSGSIYLGWHYAVDGYFSMFVVVILWISIRYITAAWAGGALARSEVSTPGASMDVSSHGV